MFKMSLRNHTVVLAIVLAVVFSVLFFGSISVLMWSTLTAQATAQDGLTVERYTTLSGGGHQHDDISFEEWTSTNSLPSSAGNYRLTADVTISSTWNVPSGTTNLCLNGHGIRISGSSRIIYVNGSTLNLYDCNTTTTHKYTISSPTQGAGLATVNDSLTSGYETFIGGYLTGANTSEWGSAVCIENGGLFTLNGGTIIGNNMSGSFGGAVGLKGYSGDRFVMNGGAIIGNTTTNGWGAGVYMHEGASFTMNGGVIKQNYAVKGGGSCGGGISVEGGSSSFILNGGQIINNVAQGHGGNVNLAAATTKISGNITITGGKLSSGTTDNVYVNGTRVFTITGALDTGTSIGLSRTNGVFTSGWSTYMDSEAKPSDYFFNDTNNGAEVFLNASGEVELGSIPHEHDGIVFSKWTSTNSLPTSGNYYLASDVTVSSTTTVSGTLNLCLNGHSITYTGASGMVFNVNGNGKSMTLCDCDDTTHYYYIDSGTNLGVVVGTESEAQAGNADRNGTFKGGYITGGKGNRGANPIVGGAFYVGSGGVFTLKGGTLIGNVAAFGGAIQVRYRSSFTMTGGAIIGNSGNGGAINADGNASNKSSVSILGGVIKDNTSGIRIGTTGSSLLALSGNIEIFNNNDYDLSLLESRIIRIDGALSNTNKIRISIQNAPRIFTSGWNDKMGTADPADYFECVDTNYMVERSGNEAKAAPAHVHSWEYTVSGNVITANCVGTAGTCDLTSQTLTITATGKTYDGTVVTATVTKSENWDAYGLATPGDITYSGNTNAGTYTASVTAGEKTASIEFTIAKAALTVTASAQSKVYGKPDPALTYTSEGLIGNDTFSGALSREEGANVGTYAITQGTLTAGDNYTITYIGANLTITEATMTGISSEGYTGDYDGAEHGISVTAPSGATVKYGTETGVYTFSDSPAYKDAGTYTVYYQITKANYKTVTGSETVTVNKINATVTITGHNETVDYDGIEHTVTGYDAVADTELYDVTKDFDFSGEGTVSLTDAGSKRMGLAPDQFANNSPNFDTVTFVVEDGYITVTPIDVTVTITGYSDTFDYDGKAHVVMGYMAKAETDLYDVDKDFTFSGNDAVYLTDAGTSYMGLAASQFKNINPNFATVTFVVNDGFITVDPVDAVIITAPKSADPVNDGGNKALVKEGQAEGGTMVYAVVRSADDVPDDASYDAAIPVASEVGDYYVWYKVVGDDNHLDLEPKFFRVVLAEPNWVTISGVLCLRDGETPVGGIGVELKKGNEKVDAVVTEADGTYKFIVPAGVYNLVSVHDNIVETTMVVAYEDAEQNIMMSEGLTNSEIVVNPGSEDDIGVAVGGLNEEAYIIRETEGVPEDKTVFVVMTVESKTDETADSANVIKETIKYKSFTFFDLRVEKTVDSVTTVMDTTTSVLEIAIPYEKVNKKGLAVYSSHNGSVLTFVESDSKENGTFRVDKENGIVFVYTNSFSTYAIGYTPYYRVTAALSLGSFKGNANVSVKSVEGEDIYTLENVDAGNLVLTDIPAGQYFVTVTWTQGTDNKLVFNMTVAPEGVSLEPVAEDTKEARNSSALTDSSVLMVIMPGSRYDDTADVIPGDPGKGGDSEESKRRGGKKASL